jgi:hypothetical protein
MPISLKSTVAAQAAAYGGLKSSIALMDFNPGTRSWTVPSGVKRIRLFVVGGGGYGPSGSGGAQGGGYSEKTIDVTAGQVINYTVGAPGISAASTGGTSSAGGVISATGGGPYGGSPGIGSGGDINTSGGGNGGSCGGGAGHSFGNGQNGINSVSGGGFSSGRNSYVDGWKIGLLPGHNYGEGGSSIEYPGLGGGAYLNQLGGLGGGGGSNGYPGGPGLVGIEVIA